MTSTQLFSAIGQIDEKYIDQAAPAEKPRRRLVWIKFAAAAACLCLILLGSFSMFSKWPSKGAPTPSTQSSPILTDDSPAVENEGEGEWVGVQQETEASEIAGITSNKEPTKSNDATSQSEAELNSKTDAQIQGYPSYTRPENIAPPADTSSKGATRGDSSVSQDPSDYITFILFSDRAYRKLDESEFAEHGITAVPATVNEQDKYFDITENDTENEELIGAEVFKYPPNEDIMIVKKDGELSLFVIYYYILD